MLSFSRLPAIRICLLTLSLALLSMTALALAANANPLSSADSHTSASLSKSAVSREASHAKRPCNSSTHKTKRHRAPDGKCVPVKSKSHSSRSEDPGRRSGSGQSPPSGNAEPGSLAPGSDLPITETPEEDGPSTPKSPGNSDFPPDEKTPVEPIPAEESNTLAEESAPAEESNKPVETPPVTEPNEPTQPAETPIAEPVIHEEPITQPSAPFRFFSSSSFWNKPVSEAPVDPSSAAVMGAFDQLVAEEARPGGGGPWINTIKYSVPVYTVPVSQPTVAVQLVDHRPNAALSAAWSAVPLPPTAVPAAGTDGTLVVWQPSTDRLWEFHRLVHEGDGWSAAWGGAMQNVSSNIGVYGPEAWPGAETWWGASASSLSLVGGLISLEDIERGQIDHALSMSVPDVRAGVYASPAQRSDGTSTDPLSLPEGAHLRLDPHLNLASLHMPKLTRMIAEAAQHYGIFVRDYSKFVTFQAQDPTPTGTDPYKGPEGYFEGKTPRELLAFFPWSHLELLKMELHAVKRRHRRVGVLGLAR
jgi:hypothetical protein